MGMFREEESQLLRCLQCGESINDAVLHTAVECRSVDCCAHALGTADRRLVSRVQILETGIV